MMWLLSVEFWSCILTGFIVFYNLIGVIVFLLWGVSMADDKAEEPTISQFVFMVIICGPLVIVFMVITSTIAYGFIKPAKWVYEKLGKKI